MVINRYVYNYNPNSFYIKFLIMYTEEIKRRKSNAFFEMKTINAQSDQQKVIEKLGSSIYASIDTLTKLKTEIMTSDIKVLKSKILQFQRQHASFMDKQKSLMEIQENSDKIVRLKTKVKEFLESFSAEEIEKRLESIKEDHIRQSHQEVGEKQKQLQLNRYEGESLRRKLLEEQDEELKEIERLMSVIKQIAMDTSQLVLGIGLKLNIASESMKQARLKLQGGRKELVETNQYEQDASKLKLLFCILAVVVIIVAFLIIKAVTKN